MALRWLADIFTQKVNGIVTKVMVDYKTDVGEATLYRIYGEDGNIYRGVKSRFAPYPSLGDEVEMRLFRWIEVIATDTSNKQYWNIIAGCRVSTPARR